MKCYLNEGSYFAWPAVLAGGVLSSMKCYLNEGSYVLVLAIGHYPLFPQ